MELYSHIKLYLVRHRFTIVKNLSLLLILSSIASIVHAQNTSQLEGVWKLISIEQEGIYYNFKKDSVSFPSEIQTLISTVPGVPDSLQQKIMAESLKALAANFKFEFRSNGKFKFVMDSISFIVEGNYKELRSQKIIQLSNKKSVGLNDFDMDDKIKYEIKNSMLYLSMDNDDEFEIIMEKR